MRQDVLKFRQHDEGLCGLYTIVNALSEIPPQFRDVVVLVDIGDFSYADAAQILDVPIGTVMSRLHRGRRALKQHLAEGAIS